MALTILIVRNQNTTEIESYFCSIVATLVTHVVLSLVSGVPDFAGNNVHACEASVK